MSDEIETPRPDQLEVNKVVRVLACKPQKYTVHLLMKDGTERQVQSAGLPKLDYNNEARCLMLNLLTGDGYTGFPLVRFDDVEIIQVEENPS